MRKHASSPYNPNIAHVFYLAGFIESWGRGIEKMCASCREDNLPAPTFTINPSDIMIKFRAPKDRVVRVTEKVTDRVTEKVTDREKQLLSLLREDPGYTTDQLAKNLGVSRKTISIYLRKLKESEIIARIGSDRKGYWKILK